MAAGAWTVYNLAKKKIGNGTISLAGVAFRLALHTSASNANTATLGTYNSVTSEVSNGNGYATGGTAMTNEVWTVGASAGQYKFDADDVVYTATGGSIANIKFGTIYVSAAASANRHLVARSQLTTAQFTLSTGNTLTVQMAATGILTLS